MKIGTTMKAAVVVNSLLLVGVLIAHRTGYIHPFGYGRPVITATKAVATAPHVDPVAPVENDGTMMISTKSGVAIDSGNTDHLDGNIGISPARDDTPGLALDVYPQK